MITGTHINLFLIIIKATLQQNKHYVNRIIHAIIDLAVKQTCALMIIIMGIQWIASSQLQTKIYPLTLILQEHCSMEILL